MNKQKQRITIAEACGIVSTPTPRTDAKLLTVAQRTSPHFLPEMVWADFARELERELAGERETSRLLRVAMDVRDEGYTQSRRRMSELERDLDAIKTILNEETNRAEKAEAVLADPQQLHAHCLRTLNEGQIAHLFGERMTEIVNRAKKAEADLATERSRLDWLLEDNVTRFENSCFDRADIDNDMKEGAK